MCRAASLLLIRYSITGWSTRRGLEPWQKTVRSFASQFLPIRSVPPSGITSGDGEFSQIPRRAIHWCLDVGPASWSMEVGTLKRYGSPGIAYDMYHMFMFHSSWLGSICPKCPQRFEQALLRPGDSGRQSKDLSRVSAVRILKLAVVRVCIEPYACGVSAVAVCR